MDRHVIANMGAELGATTTVFPADDAVRAFLRAEGREDDFVELLADPDAAYDVTDEIDLSTLEPLIARPSSPGQRGAGAGGGRRAGQPGRDRLLGQPRPARLRHRRRDRRGPPDHRRGQLRRQPDLAARSCRTSTKMGATFELIAAGARIHQAGCMGCIGMGQAPASGRNSPAHLPAQLPRPLRHRTRTRSGCARPETAAASALTGVITDPRDLAARPGPALPDARAARSGLGEHARCSCRRCRRTRPRGSSW